MTSIVSSVLLTGIEGSIIQIEADVSEGMPIFSMVGYLASEVKEAKERVRIAIKNQGYRLPPKRITINLSPADLRKEGTAFDLPIALAILTSFGYFQQEKVSDIVIVGELSLDGNIHGITGVLPIVYCAKKHGFQKCMIPYENRKEGMLVDGIEVLPVKNLKEVISYFLGEWNCQKKIEEEKLHYQALSCKENAEIDFSHIKGQKQAKRAAEIAAAGMHNLLFIGPPGTGKTMISKGIISILPKLTFEESMEISKVYSVAGLLEEEEGRIIQRPFRSPHHSISSAALVGGGINPKPGEISLASGGVLFLDELPEFGRRTIEMLRQPLEEKKIQITRLRGCLTYPADFMLVCAMNPCHCGYFPDRNKCSCSEQQVKRYLEKISRPILDRIDLSVEVLSPAYSELIERKEKSFEECSEIIKKRVERTREIQKKRYEKEGFSFNSQINGEDFKRFCYLDSEEENFMEQMFTKLQLSARAYHRILRVARTIADMEEEENIKKIHLSEAFFYRSIDKKYWEKCI